MCKVIAGEAHNKYKIMKIQIQIQTKIQVQGEGGRQEISLCSFCISFLWCVYLVFERLCLVFESVLQQKRRGEEGRGEKR